jgi:hypothetical protein
LSQCCRVYRGLRSEPRGTVSTASAERAALVERAMSIERTVVEECTDASERTAGLERAVNGRVSHP